MSVPEIVECKINRRTTYYSGGGREGGSFGESLYAFSEILMTDDAGRHYCSRTWEELPNTAFARAHQIDQFKRRWAANERANQNPSR